MNILFSKNNRVSGTIICIMMLWTWSSCVNQSQKNTGQYGQYFEEASRNADLANEGFRRCENYKNAWLSFADPKSKLVPRRLSNREDRDVWNAWDCAADNYPFLVLTSFFTSRDQFDGIMKEMLENEKRLTSRVKTLPDTYSFSKENFLYDSVSMDRIIFGSSEYMKDGLLPLTEWLGHSPWYDRMLTMLYDLDEFVDVAGDLGEKNFGKAPEAEVNGELLQILSRMYWMTGDVKLLNWAVQIGDFFLLGGGYPLTHVDYLRLRDHGCELIAGLCELYITVHFADQNKKKVYQRPLYRLLDSVLEYGRNEDGFFYNAINPRTGNIVDTSLADTWGYTLNGFYSIYMIDSVTRYRDVVDKIFTNLHRYRNYNWEENSADGYADAIEGAINLYNRISDHRAADWIDSETKVMWSMQDSSRRGNAQQWKNSGIIEGWYGDGNFARTTIMYNLWKSQGTYVLPYSPELKLGASRKGDTLCLALNSQDAWKGKLYFDKPRHFEVMKMPIDWPRINQFPEWFTADPRKDYRILDEKGDVLYELSGKELWEGIALELNGNEPLHLIVF